MSVSSGHGSVLLRRLRISQSVSRKAAAATAKAMRYTHQYTNCVIPLTRSTDSRFAGY